MTHIISVTCQAFRGAAGKGENTERPKGAQMHSVLETSEAEPTNKQIDTITGADGRTKVAGTLKQDFVDLPRLVHNDHGTPLRPHLL